MKRFLVFSVVIISGLFTPLWLFLLLCFAYTVLFGELEVVILAGLIDGVYGLNQGIPLYLVCTLGVVVAAVVARPHLWVQQPD